jgi:hypothetical protein
MKKTFSFAILFLALIVSPFLSKADSPLTSTPFADAYQDQKMVKYAASTGKVDKKIAKYLMNPSKPVDVKAAIANAIGWDTEGKNNSKIFLQYLINKYGSEQAVRSQADASELMLVGYFKAMDNYFRPQDGMEWMDLAANKSGAGFTVRMMRALVASQVAFDSDWCQVYTIVNEVYTEDNMTWDMREEAVTIIMDYIVLYKEECK